MKRGMTACLGFTVLWLAAGAFAVELGPAEGPVKIAIDGQVRLRSDSYEDNRPDPDVDKEWSYVMQRVRLGVRVKIEDKAGVYIQLQDARIWGEEMDTVTDASADNFDLHQGYAELYLPAHFILRSGRQEIALDNERLVGALNWSNMGRAFDGLRLFTEGDDFTVNVFYTVIAEPDSTLAPKLEYDFYGGQANWHGWDWMSISGLYLVQANGVMGLARNTSGAYLKLQPGGFRAHGEYYRQTGRINNPASRSLNISAFMASYGAGWDFNNGAVGFYVFEDRLSGDRATKRDRYTVFDTLFATNHHNYGYMDNFTNIPLHTGGLGLVDTAARLYGGTGEKLRLGADFHWFKWDEEDKKGDKDAANELDLTVKSALITGLSLQAGYSVFWPQQALANLGRSATEQWSFVMATFAF